MSWQPPLEKNCNGLITGYAIQYARVESDNKMIMNVPNDTVLISGLFACAQYSVTVAAVNVQGIGPFSKPEVATSGGDSELNLIHNMYVVVHIYFTYAYYYWSGKFYCFIL